MRDTARQHVQSIDIGEPFIISHINVSYVCTLGMSTLVYLTPEWSGGPTAVTAVFRVVVGLVGTLCVSIQLTLLQGGPLRHAEKEFT